MRRKTINEIADMICGNVEHFQYRSSKCLTEFFQDCDLEQFVHDGSTRQTWVASVLDQIIQQPKDEPSLPCPGFQTVIKVLMDKADAMEHDPERAVALSKLNASLAREGIEVFYADDRFCYLRNMRTGTDGVAEPTLNRGLSAEEMRRQERLETYLDQASEDNLIKNVLLPLFRTLRFHRVSVTGHTDKALEYGKDVWMKHQLPTGHWLYVGMQAKKGKLDATGRSTANVAEILNQTSMMLGHAIFDPDINKRTLVDHAIIAAGGEITKQAKNWLGERLDASRRSQILFMDRTDIIRLFIVHNIPLPVCETTPAAAWRGRADQRKGPRGVLPEAPQRGGPLALPAAGD